MVYNLNTKSFIRKSGLIPRVPGGGLLWAWLFAAVSFESFGLGHSQKPPVQQTPLAAEELPVELPVLPGKEPSRAELVMRAFSVAYPDRVGEARFVNGDWAVPIEGVLYYYAEGRLLPEELRDQAAEYDPQPFYAYASELPPWKAPGLEEAERFRNSSLRRQTNPPKRSYHFFDALWRAHTREEAYERVKTIRFFGRNVLVHYAILEELALVEERIRAEARTDSQVQRWIDNLNTLSGWNWRSIADTQSRSFHAYGAALDLLPASQRGLATYWLWSSEHNSEWWAIPYEKRLHPPDAVIKAFEAHGFIWGGKWLFFDTMHFEYRPEILILNGLAPSVSR
jgi:hypothetical protein